MNVFPVWPVLLLIAIPLVLCVLCWLAVAIMWDLWRGKLAKPSDVVPSIPLASNSKDNWSVYVRHLSIFYTLNQPKSRMLQITLELQGNEQAQRTQTDFKFKDDKGMWYHINHYSVSGSGKNEVVVLFGEVSDDLTDFELWMRWEEQFQTKGLAIPLTIRSG